MDSISAIKEAVMQELQEGLIEILLRIKQQIFEDLLEYFSGAGKCSPLAVAPAAAESDLKCKAILVTGVRKGSKCSNKARNGIPFCGRHEGIAATNKAGISKDLPRCKAIVHNNTVHGKQCEHTPKSNSSFCGVHKGCRSNGTNTVPEAFATLQDRNESIKKLREAQPYLDRLKKEGIRVPIPIECIAIPSRHPDMFERNRENLAGEIKQEVAELRVVAKMKEEEEKTVQSILDNPPTIQQVRAAEESGMIPYEYQMWGIKCRMVAEKLYPVLKSNDVQDAWSAIQAMTSPEEYKSLKDLQVKHPHVHQWRRIVAVGIYCQRREVYKANPPTQRSKRDAIYEMTIHGRVPITDEQKMNAIGLKMRAREEEMKEAGVPYVPSDIAAKMPNELMEERERCRNKVSEGFFDPSEHPYYQTNTTKKIVYVHNKWDSRDDKILEKLQNGQRVKKSTFSNKLVIKNEDTPYEGDMGGYDSDCSKGSVAGDYFPRFIECLTPRSKKYEVWNNRRG